MSGPKKTLRKVLSESGDANIRFDELRSLLHHLGFSERIRGSHHIFKLPGLRGRILLSRSRSEARPYQVREIRDLIRANGLHLGKS